MMSAYPVTKPIAASDHAASLDSPAKEPLDALSPITPPRKKKRKPQAPNTRGAERESLASAITDFFTNSDIALEIFSYLDCTLTLRRAVCVDRHWRTLLQGSAAEKIWEQAWLTVDEVNVAAVLPQAPPGERVRIRAGTQLRGTLRISSPIHLRAESGVRLCGKLLLQEAAARAQGCSHKDSCYLWGRAEPTYVSASKYVNASKSRAANGSGATARSLVGVIEGLAVSSFSMRNPRIDRDSQPNPLPLPR